MKINALTVSVALTVILAASVLICQRPSWGQPGPTQTHSAPPDGFYPATAIPYTAPSMQHRQNEFRTKLSTLVQKLRQAEDQEAQEKITSEASELFARYFDADLNARQQQVDELMERIAKLEAQIERRREAKEDIIDVQVRVVRNEAEGLGFYSELTENAANTKTHAPAQRALPRPTPR